MGQNKGGGVCEREREREDGEREREFCIKFAKLQKVHIAYYHAHFFGGGGGGDTGSFCS